MLEAAVHTTALMFCSMRSHVSTCAGRFRYAAQLCSAEFCVLADYCLSDRWCDALDWSSSGTASMQCFGYVHSHRGRPQNVVQLLRTLADMQDVTLKRLTTTVRTRS